MEILNNICNLLITENEQITNLIILPFYFVEAYLTLYLFTYILNINLSRKKILFYILLIPIISVINNFFVGEPFNIIINYMVIFILLFFVYKISFINAILSIIIPFAIFGIVNTLVVTPFLSIFQITSNIINTVPIYQILYLICVYLIVYLIILLIKHTKFHISIDVNSINKPNKIILINLIIGIVTLCMQAILMFYYINMVPIWISILNLILLFSYFFLSLYSLIKTMKLDIATRDLENAESYNKSLTVLYDNIRGFKHDFDNMIDILGGYIKLNDMEGLEKYYSELKADCANIRNIQLLNPNIINNPGIYNLIVSEYKKATEHDIKINFEFFFDFENLQMPIYEFSKVLGILLDNAIDATSDCDEKIINLMFRASNRNHVQIVTIENTYKDKNVDTDKIFEKGISGKEDHSGIGLWEVRKIVNKHNNIVLHTTKDDKLFKQQLEIYY